MVSRKSFSGFLKTSGNALLTIEPSKFGIEAAVVGGAFSLLLVSCGQIDVMDGAVPQQPAAPQQPVAAVAGPPVPGENPGPVKIQTAYGLMNLGQVIIVDGVPLYVSANGLLPVNTSPSNGSDGGLDGGFDGGLSQSAANMNSADGSRLANVPLNRRSTVPKPGQKAVRSPETTETTASIRRSDKGDSKPGKEPQYVMLAFDGSRSLDMWRDTRRFARQNGIKFTYFISGVYFLSEANKTKYKGPGYKRGVSHIGWAKTASEVKERLDQVNAALDEGHEIASHANGHFNGSKWTYKQWHDELSQFHAILKNAYANNGLPEPGNWRSRVKNDMFKGFRAPLLGVSAGLWPALRQFGYTYDTSLTANKNYWPKKKNGVYNFPLGHVKTARSKVNTLSMDYNFYVAQSGGRPNPAKAAAYEQEMFETYMAYFNSNYKGNRAPVHIGHHFSLWNKGAYWRAMKRFAKAVCGKPDVRCSTYSGLERYIRFRESKSAASG